MNKYHAIKCEYDDMIFDSVFELSVYKTLKRAIVCTDTDIKLIVKPSIIIKPAFKCFKQRKWKCDFRLEHDEWGAVNIEAKGFPTNQFTIVMEMLEGFNPAEFQRTLIVPYSDDVSAKYKTIESKIVPLHRLGKLVMIEDYWRQLNE